MASLACVVDADPERRAARLRRLIASHRRQGFGEPARRHAWAGGELLWWATPGDPDGALDWQPTDDGFVAVVGTAFVEGLDRIEAIRWLARRLDGLGDPSDDPRVFGNYLLAVAARGELWLTGDRLGLVKLHRSRDGAVLSTSWLACAETIDRPSIDRTAAQEYVLQGGNHGDRTPIEQVGTVPAGTALELVAGRAVPVSHPHDWAGAATPGSIDEAVRACADLLVGRARAVAARFPERVTSALSGGFDSRLVLAAFRVAGTTPELFVYGPAGDEDVTVATNVARALGLPLRHVDKAALDRNAPPLDEARLQANLDFFDGLAPDGVLDRGADRATRLEQGRDGRIAINGGGGEILRNFFYLDGASRTASQVIDAFYSGYLPQVFPRPADEEAYRGAMGRSILDETGASGRLDRRRVELVYPLVRGRHWMARNNALAARTGHFLTMLMDPQLVSLAASFPLAWKDFGRLESMLIASLDPALGAQPTAYGFAPADGPPPGYRARMWLQHRRPTALRRRAASIKRQLGRIAPVQVPPSLRALFPGALEVGRLLNLEHMTARDAMDRALSLEALIRRLGARID